MIPVDDWFWADWQQLADWFRATLIEEDWCIRLRELPGAAFDGGVERKRFWRDDAAVRSHLDLRTRLQDMAVSAYAEERYAIVQARIRALGVPLSRSMPLFERFMASCLKAEIEFLAVFLDREGGRIEPQPHPDTIDGKWRQASQKIRERQIGLLIASDPAASKKVGRTLADCLDQWRGDRMRAKKQVTKHSLDEKEFAISEFESHSKTRDIGEIARAHVIAYRDHLSTTKLKTATFNKRVGHITTLITTAKKAGWIENDFAGGIYIDIPAGTNMREPFSKEELAAIFSHETFRSHCLSNNPKAAGDLQFWLPLISLTSGLISSEIMQLGPEMVGPHPTHPDIICFHVSNAGGRSLKAHARKRYVPIRKELLEGGLLDVVEKARIGGWKFLWSAIEDRQDVSLSSNMFSAFWSDFLRKTLKITDPTKALYSFRHNFRDGVSACGATDYEKDQLMGHSEAGMGAKYGTKVKPRVVDIERLDGIVQKIDWAMLGDISWTNTQDQ